MNEKISQLKFSVEQSKVENSPAIKEISEKLASILSELTDYVNQLKQKVLQEMSKQ